MESRFFGTVGIETDEIEKDIAALQRLESTQLEALGGFLGQEKRLIKRDEAIRDDVAIFLQKSAIPAEQFARARRLLRFLVEACSRFDDPPKAVIEDLNGLVPFGSDLRRCLDGLQNAIRSAVQTVEHDRTVSRCVPKLTSVSYICDVRVHFPVFDVFRDDAETRDEQPRAWTPVSIIHFGTDEDDELSCQVDLDHLDRTIKILRAARRDLANVRSRLVELGLAKETG